MFCRSAFFTIQVKVIMTMGVLALPRAVFYKCNQVRLTFSLHACSAATPGLWCCGVPRMPNTYNIKTCTLCSTTLILTACRWRYHGRTPAPDKVRIEMHQRAIPHGYTRMLVFIRGCPQACMQACLQACMQACLQACMQACLQACMQAYLQACMQAQSCDAFFHVLAHYVHSWFSCTFMNACIYAHTFTHTGAHDA
jgi:hypothetical protein